MNGREARKQLTREHVAFWKTLRERCNSKVSEINDRVQGNVQANNSLRRTLRRLQIPIATYALKQYQIVVRDVEQESAHTVYGIFRAKTFNHIKKDFVYKTIGRVKWYFVRRVVDIWVDANYYTKTHEYTIKSKQLDACDKIMQNPKPEDRTFRIPKTLKTTREKACFVRAALQTSTIQEFITKNEKNSSEVKPVAVAEIHLGARYLPKNLREIVFDESCDSTPARPM